MKGTTMAKRLTRDERNEQAAAERRAKAVAEFRLKVERERAKRVYSDRAAFDTDGDKGAMALYELVREFGSVTDGLRKNIERMQERMTQAVQRLDINESPSWYSTLLGDLPADLEQGATKRQTLADAVTRLAWATGWYVPQVLPQRERDRRDLLVGVVVVQSSVDGTWLLRRDNDEYGTKWFAGETTSWVGGDEADTAVTRYATEEAAWIAFMALCGEHV